MLSLLAHLALALAPALPSPDASARDSAGTSDRASERGIATYYAGWFHGRPTASGTVFDSADMIAAHPTLPFGTRVRVTRLATGAQVVVRVVDRGPAARPRAAGVIIDLSPHAAAELGFMGDGRTRVRLDVLPAASLAPEPAARSSAGAHGTAPAHPKARGTGNGKARTGSKAHAKAKGKTGAKAKSKAKAKRKATTKAKTKARTRSKSKAKAHRSRG